ncbi:PKD domain-containing protein [Candidatus Latescibacterota bacterium]
MKKELLLIVLLFLTIAVSTHALERPDVEFKVFQFPPENIPHIDGKTADWDIIGEDYTYRTDQLDGTTGGYDDGNVDPADLDISVKVGWVKGLNRLYFLYEAYDDYWDFALFDVSRGYRNDIFEISLDADISGGQFINNEQIEDKVENYLKFSGVHAQNYHIFTPPINNQWCMVWGGNPWIGWFPWAHQAYDYNFKPGEDGKLILEFWVTPFDYAPNDGPVRAVISKLTENDIIGLSWAVLDFDNGKKDGIGNSNLAHERMSVQNGSALCAFRLMPIEEEYLPDIEARFTFKIVDMDQRLVYFKDESIGNISKWTWHFGDGETSNEQNPIHQYLKPSINHNILLEVKGPDGMSRFSRHREVLIK